MKKINLVEAISSFLASDNIGDQKGMYHHEEIKIHLSTAFNQAIYNAWMNGKKFSDFSQLDAWSRTYPVVIGNQVAGNAVAPLPFAPVQLPDGLGVQAVYNDDMSIMLAPIESDANMIFDELEVGTMDTVPTYSLEQNPSAVGAGETSHILRLAKLPTAPATLFVNLNVMMIVPLESLDDFDELAMPSGAEDSLIRQVIDIMSKKPIPDVSNDNVITK